MITNSGLDFQGNPKLGDLAKVGGGPSLLGLDIPILGGGTLPPGPPLLPSLSCIVIHGTLKRAVVSSLCQVVLICKYLM